MTKLENRLARCANANPLQFTVRLLLMGLLLMIVSSCVIGKDIIVGDTTTPAERVEMSPVLGDTSYAALLNRGLTNDELELNIEFIDHLYDMRRQDFYYPRQGGGAYVIRYYEGNVIYASIVSSDNTTQEDIVFFQEKWYYNQNGYREEIGKRQATAFVETILKAVSAQQEESSAVKDGS